MIKKKEKCILAKAIVWFLVCVFLAIFDIFIIDSLYSISSGICLFLLFIAALFFGKNFTKTLPIIERRLRN